MDEPLKIFYLDDDANYRKLVVRILNSKQNGFNVVEADSLEDFREYLLNEKFDLVISDLDVRWDTGLQVLDFVRTHRPLIPVIIITDSRSEELAVEAMKRGAADYIFKNFNHIRLLPKSIKSAIERKKLEENQRKNYDALKMSEENYRSIFENCPDGIVVTDETGKIFSVNQAACSMLGMTVDEIRTVRLNSLLHESGCCIADLLTKKTCQANFGENSS
ncbi:MAG: response regulator [Desulfomonilaceae bacterium]